VMRRYLGLWKLTVFSASCIVIVALSSAQQQNVLSVAAKTLGADTIQTLQFTGSGATCSVGQNFTPNDPWPRVTVKRYTASIDYDMASMQQELVREMGATMPRGGGVPVTGEVRQIQAINGDLACDMPVAADPLAGSLPAGPCTPPEAGGTPPKPASAPDNQPACRVMIWSTPPGFIKAAIANHATLRNVAGGTEVTFRLDSKYKMVGFINTHHHVERVRTWINQSIIGDMLVEMEYNGYTNVGGFWFPTHIVQKEDGFPSLDLTVSTVRANTKVHTEFAANPDTVPAASSVTVKAQKLGEGIFWLTGGTHHSLAIEMKDHLILVDTPNGEARASAVIAKAKDVIPGKPVRYIVAMHHHWDHMGGIRTAIDEGATVVTHESNRGLLQRAATSSHTIKPDRLSKSNKVLKLQTIGAEGTLTDGTRTIKLYTMVDFDHTDDMLMVYLPDEKLLAEADAYTPPDTPTTPLITPKVPYAAALFDNIQRLKLDVRTIVPFHGARTADMIELARQSRRSAE
jgi:glyoxylase-like metal-dependent hydrolase (beta-lactamase superfamily II)